MRTERSRSHERGQPRITFFEVLMVLAIAFVVQAIVAYARQANGAEPAVEQTAATAPGPVCNVRSCRVVVCGFGSGFSVGEVTPGHHVFLTAAHVVRGATQVDVGIGGQWRPARVLAADASRDVAVLGVVLAQPIESLRLAERDAVAGQALRWIGCPGAGPVREGKATATGPTTFQPHPIEGDSGGPVLDAATGEVVGLTSSRGAARANANDGYMAPVADLRRLVTQACGGLPPVQDRLAPIPDPGLQPPPLPAPGPFAVVPQPEGLPPVAPPPPSGPAPVPAEDRPDVAGIAGAVAQAVAPKLVPALLPFLPEGLAAALVPAAVASGPIGLGILAGGALLRFVRRRRAGRGPPIADDSFRVPVPVSGGAAPIPAGPEPAPERLVPRDLREAHQLQQLRKLEGRHPALDATVGMVALDELEREIEGDTKHADVARQLKTRIMARVDEIAPLYAKE